MDEFKAARASPEQNKTARSIAKAMVPLMATESSMLRGITTAALVISSAVNALVRLLRKT